MGLRHSPFKLSIGYPAPDLTSLADPNPADGHGLSDRVDVAGGTCGGYKDSTSTVAFSLQQLRDQARQRQRRCRATYCHVVVMSRQVPALALVDTLGYLLPARAEEHSYFIENRMLYSPLAGHSAADAVENGYFDL